MSLKKVKHLRSNEDNWERFRETVVESTFEREDSRTLKSIADCFADYGEKEERLAALIISCFSTCFKVADSKGGHMYDGIMGLSTHDDTMSNLLFRVKREMPEHLLPIWELVVERIEEHSPTINKRKKHTPKLMEVSFYGNK